MNFYVQRPLIPKVVDFSHILNCTLLIFTNTRMPSDLIIDQNNWVILFRVEWDYKFYHFFFCKLFPPYILLKKMTPIIKIITIKYQQTRIKIWVVFAAVSLKKKKKPKTKAKTSPEPSNNKIDLGRAVSPQWQHTWGVTHPCEVHYAPVSQMTYL